MGHTSDTRVTTSHVSIPNGISVFYRSAGHKGIAKAQDAPRAPGAPACTPTSSCHAPTTSRGDAATTPSLSHASATPSHGSATTAAIPVHTPGLYPWWSHASATASTTAIWCRHSSRTPFTSTGWCRSPATTAATCRRIVSQIIEDHINHVAGKDAGDGRHIHGDYELPTDGRSEGANNKIHVSSML